MSQEKINRANRAQNLLSDELFQESLAALEAEYIRQWRESKYNDDDGRERLWLAVNVIGKVKDHLTKVISDGKVAQHDLKLVEPKRWLA